MNLVPAAPAEPKATRSRARWRLTDRGVETAPAGAHPDGGGLFLHVSEKGNRRWELRYVSPVTGKRVGMGLGSARKGTAGYVGLAGAREAADKARQLVAKGLDPVAEREREKARRAEAARNADKPKTFGAFAETWLNEKESEFQNEKHRAQWRSTLSIARGANGDYLNTGYCQSLRNKLLDEITRDDVLAVLKPIWTRLPETAKRVQGRIERVLNVATATGLRSEAKANPARWKGSLDDLLPKRPKARHQPAMPYENVPAFMAVLRKRTSISARALEFLILTAARSGEVRGMTWAELDAERTTWTVPSERMKAKVEHRVPLTDRAREILSEMDRFRPVDRPDTGLVFPGARTRTKRGALSDMTLTKLLRDMRDAKGAEHEALRQLLKDASGEPVVVHGFRSTFRDWAEDVARFPARVVEHALAHTIKDKAEAAYRRGDAFEQRKALMVMWAAYLASVP